MVWGDLQCMPKSLFSEGDGSTGVRAANEGVENTNGGQD